MGNDIVLTESKALDNSRFKSEIIESVSYLKGLKNISEVFEDFNGFYKAAIFFLTQIISPDLLEWFIENSSPDLFIKFFEYFNKIQNELIFNGKTVIDMNDLKKAVNNLDAERATLYRLLLLSINQYLKYSVNFCIRFSTNGGLKSWLKYLTDEKYLEKNLNVKLILNDGIFNPIDFLVLNISSLSKACEENKKVWIELNTIDVLLKLVKLKESLRNDAYSAIVNIADDKQLETLPEMKSVKQMVVGSLEKVANDFEKGIFRRDMRQMNIRGELLNCEVMIYNTGDTASSVVFQLNLIYKLCINKKLRTELYFEHNLMKHLKIIFLNGNYFEIYYVLHVMMQLTLDEKISFELMSDIELNKLFEKYIQQNEKEIASEVERKCGMV